MFSRKVVCSDGVLTQPISVRLIGCIYRHIVDGGWLDGYPQVGGNPLVHFSVTVSKGKAGGAIVAISRNINYVG